MDWKANIKVYSKPRSSISRSTGSSRASSFFDDETDDCQSSSNHFSKRTEDDLNWASKYLHSDNFHGDRRSYALPENNTINNSLKSDNHSNYRYDNRENDNHGDHHHDRLQYGNHRYSSSPVMAKPTRRTYADLKASFASRDPSENDSPTTRGRSSHITIGRFDQDSLITRGCSSPITRGRFDQDSLITRGRTSPITRGRFDQDSLITRGRSDYDSPITRGCSDYDSPFTRGRSPPDSRDLSSGYRSKAGRAVSETRKKLRSIICRSRNDPNYFDD